MALKKKTFQDVPSSLRRATKEQPKKTQLFSKRKIISLKFMSQSTLEKMGYFEEVQTMFNRVGIYKFSFEALLTYPYLLLESAIHQLYAHHNIQCTWPPPPPF